MKSEHLLILIAVLVLGTLIALKVSATHKEGFANIPGKQKKKQKGNTTKNSDAPNGGMAKVPSPEGTSTMPNTMPGGTTPNSKTALAGFKDLADLLDAMKTYNALYEENITALSKNDKYKFLHANSISYQVKIMAQVDTGSIVDSLDFVTRQRNKYKAAIKVIRGDVDNIRADNEKKAETKVMKSFASDSGISLKDIEYVTRRAKEEQKRIDDLRSESPELKRRSQILERIRLDLTGFIDKIKKGDMAIGDVPFSKLELRRFLIEIENPSALVRALPQLGSAEGRPRDQPKTAAGVAAAAASGGLPGLGGINPAALAQQLRSATRDLSWEVYIGYDPQVTIQRRMLERLQMLTRQIESGKLKRAELDAKMLELKVLRQQINTYNRRRVAESDDPLQPYESFESGKASGSDLLEEAYAPTPVEPVSSSMNVIKSLQPPNPSNDWRTRPGYDMDNDAIAKRASAASYDDKLSGPDYKKRAKFLCQQIRGAELGNPKDFGCIENPEEDVSPEYSWKGNYKMVCSRLGQTWGAWYPEMFGCPADQQSVSQVPKVRINQ
jgi:hypothetical protein